MKDILVDLLDRPIAFHRIFVTISGSVVAALFLSQAVYWQRRCPPGRDGWWWKTGSEWMAETGLSRAEQERARKIWRNLNILEEQRKGIPCRLWFRLDLSELALAIQSAANGQTGKCGKQACRDSAGRFVKCGESSATSAGQPNQLNTTEISSNSPAAFGGGKEPNSVIRNRVRSASEIENLLGIRFPQSILGLGNPDRVLSILLRSKIDTELARRVLAEFDACCARRKVEDPWALLATMARKASAGKLKLTSMGEERLPSWV